MQISADKVTHVFDKCDTKHDTPKQIMQ